MNKPGRIQSYRFTVMVNSDHVDKAFAVRDEVEKHMNEAAKLGSAPGNTEVFIGDLFTVCHRAPGVA